MLMCAKQMKAEGRLRGNAVVATVMSNIGLEIALKKLGIELIRTKVGDKYVMEEMQKRNLSLGGEQSGHLIFSEHLFTGDGLITALSVLRTMAASGRELADLADDLTTYPQVLLNVRVREKAELENDSRSRRGHEQRSEQQLGGNGRLLVRYSGTEPLLRVMLEGQDLQRDRPVGAVRLSMPSIKLSVNVNKVATLRNSRGGSEPDVLEAVAACVDGGRSGHYGASTRRRASHQDARTCTTSPSC